MKTHIVLEKCFNAQLLRNEVALQCLDFLAWRFPGVGLRDKVFGLGPVYRVGVMRLVLELPRLPDEIQGDFVLFMCA